MKTGVVDTGGGLRGVYAAGVLDGCMDMSIRFDVGIGVSAGSANIASYIAGQRKRNYQFYVEYSARKEYMSLRNFIFKRSYIDLDYVYGTLSNADGENPLDYYSFIDNPAEFIAVATDAMTGEAVYFDKKDVPFNDYAVVKASCAIPFVCRPYDVYERPYYDGALGDPVPIEKAFSMGCEKVVLLLTKPKDVPRLPESDTKLAARIRRKYPLAADKLEQRAERYNEGVAAAKKYEEQGRLLIVAPDDTCGVSTLSRDKDALKRLYEKGYKDAGAISEFLSE